MTETKKWCDVNDGCVLCKELPKYRGNRFLRCSFSEQVWTYILRLCGISTGIGVQEDELPWALQCIKAKYEGYTLKVGVEWSGMKETNT